MASRAEALGGTEVPTPTQMFEGTQLYIDSDGTSPALRQCLDPAGGLTRDWTAPPVLSSLGDEAG